MAKDAIYLRGFRQVVDLVASGASLAPFWLGKIAPGHAPAIEELLLRGLVHEPVFIPEFLARPDTRDAHRAFAGGASLSIDVQSGDAFMLIAFFVNDMEREFAGYTTTVLAYEAASRGHRVCYVTPSDFVLNPDDSLSVHGRFPPKKKYKDRPEFFDDADRQGDQGRGGRHDRGRRADAAQRPVDRRPGQCRGRWTSASCSGARRPSAG